MGLSDFKAFWKHLVESKGRLYDAEGHEHLMAKNRNFAPHRESLEVYGCEQLHCFMGGRMIIYCQIFREKPWRCQQLDIRYSFTHLTSSALWTRCLVSLCPWEVSSITSFPSNKSTKTETPQG